MYRIVLPSTFEALYSPPVRIGMLMYLASLIFSSLLARTHRGLREVLLILAVMMIVAGVWLSHAKRFSAGFVITEGQRIETRNANYLPESQYKGAQASVPEISLLLSGLEPSFNDTKTRLLRLKGSFVAGSDEQNKHVLTRGLPKYLDGAWYSLDDFGYSPRFSLLDDRGTVLNSSFVYLRLFPPGQEDVFRLLEPITYTLRYYPDGTGDRDGALFGVRVSQNKDLIYDDFVALGQRFSFQGGMMSFDELRMWTVVRIVKDPGLPLLFVGGILIVAVMFLRIRQSDKLETL